MSTELDNVIQALNDAQGNAVDLGGYFRPDARRQTPSCAGGDVQRVARSRWRLNSALMG